MSVKLRNTLVHPDPWLLTTATLLILGGLIMVASASVDLADRYEVSSDYFVQRQLLYVVAGTLLATLSLRVPLHWWHDQAWMLLALAFIVLLLVFVPGLGKTVNGSTRWLDLRIMNVQASEIAKFCLVMYTASYLVRRQAEIRTRLWGFLKPLLIFCVMAVLLLLEPDFGALVVTLCALMGMIFLSGVRILHFTLIIGTALGALALIAISQEYRMHRLTAFTQPFADEFGSGYQLTQALIAFGRGEWFGVGLGNSIQKLSFLPEAHTDFVFAIIGEELGVFGCVGVLLLFGLFLGRALLIGRRAEIRSDFFSAYVVYGLTLILAAQVLINLGVNTGLLPTKGLTLPFISYGGSSLLMCLISLGVISRVSHDNVTATRSAQKGAGESAQSILKPANQRSAQTATECSV